MHVFLREKLIPWKSTTLEESRRNFTAAWAAPVLLAQAVQPVTVEISRAFDPVIQVVQAAGYPICMLMISGGTLLLMTGHRERGLTMIKNAALGFIALHFVPVIMQLLVQVARAMQAGGN